MIFIIRNIKNYKHKRKLQKGKKRKGKREDFIHVSKEMLK